MCVQEPQYDGGRGEACNPCADAGDAGLTFGLMIGGLAMAVILALLSGIFFKKRAVRWTSRLVDMAASVKTTNRNETIESAVAAEISNKASKIGTWTIRLVQRVGDMGVKARILISLSQVLGQVGATYKIQFPEFYKKLLEALDSINLPIKLLPFGCSFPNLDNFMFELVLKTSLPLGSPQIR